MLNCRDWSGRFLRVIQLSNDGGKTWLPPRYDSALCEPEPQGCQGSLLCANPPAIELSPPSSSRSASVARPGSGGGGLFFCNPASDRREMLTVRKSVDNGASWATNFCLERGPSAYSCLGLTHDGHLGVLFERGNQISFARIPSAPNAPLGSF